MAHRSNSPKLRSDTEASAIDEAFARAQEPGESLHLQPPIEDKPLALGLKPPVVAHDVVTIEKGSWSRPGNRRSVEG